MGCARFGAPVEPVGAVPETLYIGQITCLHSAPIACKVQLTWYFVSSDGSLELVVTAKSEPNRRDLPKT